MMKNILCDEKIIGIYKEHRCSYADGDGVFDCFSGPSYYAAPGKGIVFETANYYILLDVDGVKINHKNSTISSTFNCNEQAASLAIDNPEKVAEDNMYAATLFKGERILGFDFEEGYYFVYFTHFPLKVQRLTTEILEEFNNFWNVSYKHVYGCEHRIGGGCTCGGSGELVADYWFNFAVRCIRCGKATRFGTNAKTVIKDWRDGKIADEVLI